MFHYFARFLCAVFCLLFFRLRASGRAKVPKRGGFILAGNHVSYLDPVVFGVACPRSLNYMARSTLFENRFFGSIISWCHAFPVKRDGADIGAFRESLKRLKKGEGVLLFPEGTRSFGDDFGVPQAGIGFLVRKSGVPVVPAFAYGSNKALPRGAKFPKPATIRVVFGEPLIFSETQKLSDLEISQEIMRQIRRLKENLLC